MDVAADDQAQLVVSRTSERDARQRQVFVTLDDTPVGDLVFGETISRAIPAGRHTLKANNTMVWKKVEFVAKPGEEIRFSAINYSGKGFWAFMLFLGVAPLYLSLERETPQATHLPI